MLFQEDNCLKSLTSLTMTFGYMRTLSLILIITIIPFSTELDYLHNLRKYELVEPFHLSEQSRSKRDLSTKQSSFKNDDHLDETRFYVNGFKRDFHISLQKNRDLLPSSYYLIYQDANGKKIKDKKRPENCYYHGELEDKSNTYVVFSTCNGLKGLIRDDDGEEFYIDSFQDGKNTHVMYNIKDLISNKTRTCGHNHTYDADQLFGGEEFIHSRKRRDASSYRKQYIETAVVVDYMRFSQLGKNIGDVEKRVFEIMNHVDRIYKLLNTRVPLISLTIWNTNDLISVSTNAGETLSGFRSYTKDILNGAEKVYPDNAQLLTGVDFDGSTVGLAGVDVMCSMTSCGVNMDHGNSASVSANTVAHEMGHNLGFLHFTGSCSCKNTPCLMNPYSPGTDVMGFTDCTLKKFESQIKQQKYPCLLDYPENIFGPPICGDGYKEEGEECDCGSEEECKAAGVDKCCEASTCKLKDNAQCADGLCCKDCKFKEQGSLCREKFHSECDLEESCAGTSSECPRNFYVRDGSPCSNGAAYCHQGICKTYDDQCQTLWGPNAMKANDICFDANKDGDDYGNCGKNLAGDYIKCEKKNLKCGKVQCKSQPGKVTPKFPIIGSNKGINYRSYYVGNVEYNCRIAKVDFGPDSADPTLVLEGTKCAENKFCVDNECVNISSITYLKSCGNKCKNGGVCNNNGNCHCPRGFGCPYCEFAGLGGSLDSGQGCIVQDDGSCLTPLVKGMLVLFLLVIPLLCVIAFFAYRHKEELRARWRSRGQRSAETQQHDKVATKSFVKEQKITHMQTGVPSVNVTQIGNPYSNTNQPSRKPAPQKPTYKPPSHSPPQPSGTSGKPAPPPKLPASSPRPGKLQQIDKFNKLDANARTEPQVKIRQPHR